ncbi:MAG: hypothetical protein ACRCU2_17210 [Planktothrix sp.]
MKAVWEFSLCRTAFITMNPGNGIETHAAIAGTHSLNFHYNESRQRD